MSTSSSHAFPTLFVSHGAPTLALDPGDTGPALARIAAEIPRPCAIVVASAHWETEEPRASSVAAPRTIHDFRGFPPALYALRYPAPGEPKLAERVAALLSAAGFAARTDDSWGLDHGAWVPLRYLYPAADVPTLQLSIQPQRDPLHHYRIGQALAPLRDEGVLVMGSGSFTHNLSAVQFNAPDRGAPEWVEAFRAWFTDALVRHDLEALLDYRRRAPYAERNHPTDEHLLPLYIPLGAAGTNAILRHAHASVTFGVLGMDAFVFG